MADLLGSETLKGFSDALDEALRLQQAKLLSPDNRKSDKPLRRFTIREMADLALRVNYNTLRHYLKTYEDLPQGIMEPGNKRTFSLEEVHEVQRMLFEKGKIPPALYPEKQAGEATTVLLTYNLKGGVAKSSTVVNVAEFLALRGYKILVIDLDPQASCSDMFDVQTDLDDLPSIYDVLRYDDPEHGEFAQPMAEVIRATYFPNIDIVPGSISLTEFEFETAINAAKGVPFYTRLTDALAPVIDAYDIVMFDTPPHMSFSVIAAIYASNAMLIPLSAGMLDVVSLVKFLELASGTLVSIEGVDETKRFDFIRILLTRYSPSDSAQQQLSAFLRYVLDKTMLSTDFLSSTAIADAGNTMNPLLEVEPGDFTRKTYDRILESLHGIALEVEGEILKARGREIEMEDS